MVKVSIIMPVYNSEKYLEHAVNSILSQDFDDFELILVDDGSPDNSGKICDDFAKKDKRVKVIHKQNGGICSARNAGLDLAQGEYVGFCDNDDEYLPHLISENYKFADDNHLDVVRYCRKKITTQDGKIVDETETGGFPKCVIKKGDIPKMYQQIKKSRGGVWTGFYRANFLKKYHIKFDESMRFGCEDHMFNLSCYAHCNSIGLNPKVYYAWLQKIEHSTTGKFSINIIDSLKKCIKLEEEFFRVNRIYEYNEGFWQYIFAQDYISEVYERLGPTRSSNLTDEERKKILKDFRDDCQKQCEGSLKDALLIYRKNFKLGIIWTLFKWRFTWFLYVLIFKRKKIFK